MDGRPLSQYDHTYFHTRISLVGQEPVLYARSVAENISYNLQGATQEAVVHAAKLANAHDFISAMTDGYNTQTGEKGTCTHGTACISCHNIIDFYHQASHVAAME